MGAFVLPLRVSSREHMTRDNECVFFLELKNISNHAHKTRSLRGSFQNFRRATPSFLYEGPLPHPRARVLIARVRRLNNYELKDARKFLLLTVSNCRGFLEWEFPLFQKRLRMQESPEQRRNEDNFLLDFGAKKNGRRLPTFARSDDGENGNKIMT